MSRAADSGAVDRIADHRDDLQDLAEREDLNASRYAEALLALKEDG